MENEGDNQVGALVNKFKQTTIDLGDVSNVVVVQKGKNISEKDERETSWEVAAIGKVIIEGRMNYDLVQKFIQFTWPFMTGDDLKIVEIDPNLFIFKFSNWDLLNKVIEERPWHINKKILVVHDYIPELIYTEKHWGSQLFWIQLRYLLPEHMNVASLQKLEKLWVKLWPSKPKDAIPVGSVPLKVCVNIDLTDPLRGVVKSITNAGLSKWIRLYYERQPSGICSDCYVIKHCKCACKDASIFLAKAHEKPYFFGSASNLKKTISFTSTTKTPMARNTRKNFTKTTMFIPPKDGIPINMEFLLKDTEENNDESSMLGKRIRTSEERTYSSSDIVSSLSNASADNITENQTSQRCTTQKKQAGVAFKESQGFKSPSTRNHPLQENWTLATTRIQLVQGRFEWLEAYNSRRGNGYPLWVKAYLLKVYTNDSAGTNVFQLQ